MWEAKEVDEVLGGPQSEAAQLVKEVYTVRPEGNAMLSRRRLVLLHLCSAKGFCWLLLLHEVFNTPEATNVWTGYRLQKICLGSLLDHRHC